MYIFLDIDITAWFVGYTTSKHCNLLLQYCVKHEKK
jgi:hypothetical protein